MAAGALALAQRAASAQTIPGLPGQPHLPAPATTGQAAPEDARAAAGSEPTADAEPADVGERIDVALTGEVLLEARAALHELEALETDGQLDEELREVGAGLPEQARAIADEATRARRRVQEAARWVDVADIEYQFRQRLADLEPLLARAEKQLQGINEAKDRVDSILATWRRALLDLQQARSPSAELTERVEKVITQAEQAGRRLQSAETRASQLQIALGDIVEDIEQLLEFTAEHGASLVRDLKQRGALPWQAASALAEGDPWQQRLQARGQHHARLLRSFVTRSRATLYVNAALVLLALAACLWLRRRARSWREIDRAHLAAILGYPGAASILLGAIASVFLYPAQPAFVSMIAYVTAAAAVLRLAPALFPWIGGPQLVALYLLLLIDAARALFTEAGGIEPLVLLLEGLGTAGCLVHLMRVHARQRGAEAGAWDHLQRTVLLSWIAALSLGLGASLLGFAATGALLISATVLVLFATLIWGTAFRLTVSAIRMAVRSEAARRLHALKHHGRLVARRLALAALILFGFFWCRTVLRQYTLFDVVAESIGQLLAFEVSVGSLDVSVYDVTVLTLGVLLAVLFARFVRFVLDEDMLPRAGLAAGGQAAVSMCAYYAVLSVGLLVALAAAGLELGKLTFVMGALGIGIGFGLQNVIQNFVSGLMLIFGRAITVGDTVQVGELVGQIRSIGFRASVIRSFQGAEVIVPNAELISSQVINWTLSDRHRRIELDIGVAYGTDPEQVIEILLDIARAHEDILGDPAPDALFVAHGAGSLDFQLRAWTGNAGLWPNIKSDLTIAVNRAFAAADIEIPLPQRDLHLRSIDERSVSGLADRAERFRLRDVNDGRRTEQAERDE